MGYYTYLGLNFKGRAFIELVFNKELVNVGDSLMFAFCFCWCLCYDLHAIYVLHEKNYSMNFIENFLHFTSRKRTDLKLRTVKKWKKKIQGSRQEISFLI